MRGNSDIENELREVSPALAGMERGELYAIPEGYFERLSSVIIDRIRTGETAGFYLPKANPYTAPTGYFEGLAEQILQKVRTAKQDVYHELEHVAPLLNTIGKQQPYSVPEGYFTQKPITPAEKPKAKVVGMSSWRRITTYAAAAVVTGVIGVGIYLFEKPASTVTENPSVAVKRLTDDEISNYLKTAPVSEELMSTSGVKTSSPTKYSDINQSVKQIPDQELQQYLTEFGDTEGI